MCVLSIKVPIRKKSGNLLKVSRTSAGIVNQKYCYLVPTKPVNLPLIRSEHDSQHIDKHRVHGIGVIDITI